MSGRVSLFRWTNHPAVHVWSFVFLMRDIVLVALAIGGLVAGALAHQDTLSIVALVLAGLALTGVVVSSLMGQRRTAGLSAGHDASVRPYSGTGRADPRVHETPDVRREEPAAPPTSPGTVADQVHSGKQLRAEICGAQERGAWDDEDWAYRRRVEEWTERTANLLANCGRDDLARALAEVEVPPRPPFESLLKGCSPSYARLVGLLDGRLGLLERSQA
jgi:pimeloyl-ACP methyl ester carboxylesterase